MLKSAVVEDLGRVRSLEVSLRAIAFSFFLFFFLSVRLTSSSSKLISNKEENKKN